MDEWEVVCISEVEIYYFYGKINWGYVVCPLYGGNLYLRESVMRGSTVIHYLTCFELATSILASVIDISCWSCFFVFSSVVSWSWR